MNALATLRSWLVRTEAGLAVHRSPARPALALDGELPETFRLGAVDVTFSCQLAGRGSCAVSSATARRDGHPFNPTKEARG